MFVRAMNRNEIGNKNRDENYGNYDAGIPLA